MGNAKPYESSSGYPQDGMIANRGREVQAKVSSHLITVVTSGKYRSPIELPVAVAKGRVLLVTQDNKKHPADNYKIVL